MAELTQADPPGEGPAAGPDAPADLAQITWEGDPETGEVAVTATFHDPLPENSDLMVQINLQTAWPAVGEEPAKVLLLVRDGGRWRSPTFDEAELGTEPPSPENDPFRKPPPEGASEVEVSEDATTVSITFPLASLRGDEQRFTWSGDVMVYDPSSSQLNGFGDGCGGDGQALVYDYLGHVFPPRDLQSDVVVDG